MGTVPRPARALRVQPADRSTFTPAAQTARMSCRGADAGRPVRPSVRSRDDPRPIPLQLGLAMTRQGAPIGCRHGPPTPSFLAMAHPLTPLPPRFSSTLQTNEMAVYRRPPSAFFFSPPQRGKGSSDWRDVLGSPCPFTNHGERYTPSGVVQPMRRRARRPAVQFLPRLGSFAVLNSSGFSLRAGRSDWPLLLLSNLFSSQPRTEAIPPSFASAAFGIPRCWGVVSWQRFLIGYSGRSAFSGRSRKPTTSLIGSGLGFGFPAEAGGRGLGGRFPDACYAGGGALGGVRLGGGGRRRRTSRKGEGEWGRARRLRRRRASHRAAPDPAECGLVPPPSPPPGPSDKGRKAVRRSRPCSR